MPWAPELFSAPALARYEERHRHAADGVPYFEGLMMGELDALVGSFTGSPELHDPVRGRIRGTAAFETFASETRSWLEYRRASLRQVSHVIAKDRAAEEVVLELDGPADRVEVPVAIVADLGAGGRMEEVRVYFSNWALSGRHANRPPLLQPDPALRQPDVVGEYQGALATGDLDRILAAFEPDGYAREPAGGPHVHRGPDGLRSFYELLFSNGGGIPLEHCAMLDDGRACVIEYNVARWGETDLQPQAGVAVYDRGESGRLAAARIYDDVDPPLGASP